MSQEKQLKRQADKPCSKCGSWYRLGDNCNKCVEHAPISDSFYSDIGPVFTRKGKEAKGADWDKKQHKVVWR
jgi:hypothetical protein